MKESALEATLASRVSDLGGRSYKFTSAVSGVPDRIVLHKGRVYFVEMKQPDGDASKLQLARHREMVAAGADVRTLWSIEDVTAFVDELTVATWPPGRTRLGVTIR